MLDDIYHEKILEYAANIQRTGRLKEPQATAKRSSRLCGSMVLVDMCVDVQHGQLVVSDFSHDVKACALGQASSSIMARNVIGANATELKELRQIILAMFKENGMPPTGKFEEFKYLEPVREYEARHASAMLTFDAVVDCLEQIEKDNDVKNHIE